MSERKVESEFETKHPKKAKRDKSETERSAAPPGA
jgi:hypothetical protein